jgi:ribosomal protein S18 acetylase RimI-like enzyme
MKNMKDEIIIQEATIKDAKEINQLNSAFFGEKNRNFDKIISSPNKKILLAKDGERIIGFAGIELSEWNKTARGIDIFVHPDYRQKGIGSNLVREMIEETKKFKVRALIVEAPSKSNALPLYQKNGFRKCGYNDRYYSNNNDEIAIFLSYDL